MWADNACTLCTACEDRPAAHELADQIAEATAHGREPTPLELLAREVRILVNERDAARAELAAAGTGRA
jgi:hypothetical protein